MQPQPETKAITFPSNFFSLLLLLFLPKVLRRQIFLFLQIHWNFFIFQFISEICKSTSNVFLSFKCFILSVESPTFLFSLSIFHRFFKKSNKHFLFLIFLYSFCFPPSQISQASNISFPPISLPPFPQLSRFFRVPGESQGERERPPAAHEKREFHASILWRPVKKETVTHYRLHSPGLREVSAKRSSPITKMEEIPPVTRRTQERTRKNLLLSFVHDSDTSKQR